jgi:hypothetical protein
MNYRSSIRTNGSVDDPDFIWYNADIINNNQIDQINGVAVTDPQVRFNETRDKPILNNCSDYHFSIIRFSMNGSNLDIPLFCPTVELCTQWPTWAAGTVSTTGLPITYAVGDTVIFNPLSQRPPYNSYKCILANTASPANAPGNATYWTPVAADGAVYDGDAVQTVYSFTLSYQQRWNTPGATMTDFTAVSPQIFMAWNPQINNNVVAPPPLVGQITRQDLNSRFWWAQDYNWVVNLMNTTLTVAWIDVWSSFRSQWNIAYGAGTSPYETYASWVNGVGNPPQFVWDGVKRTFTLFADSDTWGQRLTTFTGGSTSGTPVYAPYSRMFMNNNMYGLLSGMPTIYWNTDVIPVPIFTYNVPGSPANIGSPWTTCPDLSGVAGGTNEVFFANAYYSNVSDYRLSPYSGTPPLGFVPTTPINQQKVYWALQQDFKCVDTLWSPVQTLVFTTSLIPLFRETQSKPTLLGGSNLGNSAATAPSSFQPILTDFEIDLHELGADAYRGFVQYNPTAEYRMADMAGNQPIRSIDIQMWWKNRLDGQLYPVNMFNLSSVSLRLLFKKKKRFHL